MESVSQENQSGSSYQDAQGLQWRRIQEAAVEAEKAQRRYDGGKESQIDEKVEQEFLKTQTLREKKDAFLSNVVSAGHSAGKSSQSSEFREPHITKLSEQLTHTVKDLMENRPGQSKYSTDTQPRMPNQFGRLRTSSDDREGIRVGDTSGAYSQYLEARHPSHTSPSEHHKALHTNVARSEVANAVPGRGEVPSTVPGLKVPQRVAPFAKSRDPDPAAPPGSQGSGGSGGDSPEIRKGSAEWMAKQEDLHRRRQEFHGAVTYEFDGVFAWQMYGTANAVDFSGPYTEYVMRCQWGRDWSTLRPWLVTRRYREFEALDSKLRQDFPQIAHMLHPLPAKLVLTVSGLSTALGIGDPNPKIVAKRKLGLEHYITAIVTAIPVALRSPAFMEFLSIGERVQLIRRELAVEQREASRGAVGAAPDGAGSWGADSEGSVSAPDRAKSPRPPDSVAAAAPNKIEPDDDKPLTLRELPNKEMVDRAFQNRFGTGGPGASLPLPQPLTDIELLNLEDSLKELKVLMKALPAKMLLANAEFKRCLRACVAQWPALYCLAHMSEDPRVQGTIPLMLITDLVPRSQRIEQGLSAITEGVRNILSTARSDSTMPLHTL